MWWKSRSLGLSMTPCPFLALGAQVAHPGPGAPSCWEVLLCLCVLWHSWEMAVIGLCCRWVCRGTTKSRACHSSTVTAKEAYRQSIGQHGQPSTGPWRIRGNFPASIVDWETPWGPNPGPPLPWEKWDQSPFLPVLSRLMFSCLISSSFLFPSLGL